jgi:hypothetical protein
MCGIGRACGPSDVKLMPTSTGLGSARGCTHQFGIFRAALIQAYRVAKQDIIVANNLKPPYA